MKKIAIAPYAAKLPNGKRNPKEFPAWPELIERLNAEGYEVIQLGAKGEKRLAGTAQFIEGYPLEKLEQVIRDCDTWIAVDTWMSHFCATMRLQGGIVIWAQSNPKIWGYPHNTNLLKDESYLREWQYAPWWDAEYNEDAFVEPQVVMDALHGRLAHNATAKS